MLSTDLSKSLQSFPSIYHHFKGFFCADTKPKSLKANEFVIFNTDVSDGPGKHWFCVLKIAPSTLEVFDSLGIDHEKRTFLQSNLHLPGIKEIEFNEDLLIIPTVK